MSREASGSSNYYYSSSDPSKRIPVSQWSSLSQGNYPTTSHGHSQSYYPPYHSQSSGMNDARYTHQHGNYAAQQQQWEAHNMAVQPRQQQPSASLAAQSGSSSHDVRPLPTISDAEVQKWLESYTFGDKLYWRCRWDGCADPLLPRGPQAYDHVARHLAIKQYECMTCNKTFATKATASRHQNTQEKTFPCQYCGNYFARKDYRNTHERKCHLAPLT